MGSDLRVLAVRWCRAAARRRGRCGEAPGAGAQGTTRRERIARSSGRGPGASGRPKRRTRVDARSSIAGVAATILIVEDEHAVARGIQYALQQEGYEVGVARSGEEGLEIATREAPDLVVLDVRLPGHRWLRGPPPHPRGRRQDADPRAHGPRRRGRQGHRPRARRGRLPDQAVRAARADEPDQGPPASLVRRPRGRRPAAGSSGTRT